MWETILNRPKNRQFAAALALLGTVTPISGLHKFYLGQPFWGGVYLLLLLFVPPLPHIACAIEAVWYLFLDRSQFDRRFNSADPTLNLAASKEIASSVDNVSTALRQLDGLREDGLISEYEFEQKRRQLLDRLN